MKLNSEWCPLTRHLDLALIPRNQWSLYPFQAVTKLKQKKINKKVHLKKTVLHQNDVLLMFLRLRLIINSAFISQAIMVFNNVCKFKYQLIFFFIIIILSLLKLISININIIIRFYAVTLESTNSKIRTWVHWTQMVYK